MVRDQPIHPGPPETGVSGSAHNFLWWLFRA